MGAARQPAALFHGSSVELDRVEPHRPPALGPREEARRGVYATHSFELAICFAVVAESQGVRIVSGTSPADFHVRRAPGSTLSDQSLWVHELSPDGFEHCGGWEWRSDHSQLVLRRHEIVPAQWWSRIRIDARLARLSSSVDL